MEGNAIHPLIKQLHEIRKNNSFTPEKYIEILEIIIVTESTYFGDAFRQLIAIRKALNEAKPSLDQIKKVTEEILQGYIETTIELYKYRGKKISPENKELYYLIEQKNKERMKKGEDSNYKQSTKSAVKEKYRSSNGWEKHYKNFMDYKNSSLKKKSVIRKPS